MSYFFVAYIVLLPILIFFLFKKSKAHPFINLIVSTFLITPFLMYTSFIIGGFAPHFTFFVLLTVTTGILIGTRSLQFKKWPLYYYLIFPILAGLCAWVFITQNLTGILFYALPYYLSVGATILGPISIFLLWFYEEKKFPKITLKILLLCFFVCLAIVCLNFLVNKIYPMEVVSEILSYFIVLTCWGFYIRRHFKFKKIISIFIFFLPLSFLTYYALINNFIYHLDDSKRETAFLKKQVQESFGGIRLSIEDFYRYCGYYPQTLNELIMKPIDCPKWEKSVYYEYMGKSLFNDPWDHPFEYASDKKTYWQVKTFGADGKAGGEGIDEDQAYRGP